MKRYLEDDLRHRLGPRIVLLSGPRQVGKTFLAQSLESDAAYYNYDIQRDRGVFRSGEWDSKAPLVIFDEIHKMKRWKLWLKGLYDEGRFKKQPCLVTGSARLQHIRKVGDSLAGRYFGFRLHPLDLKELGSISEYGKLIERGGFPEPFLSPDPDFHRLWRKSHLDVILRQDLLSLEVIRDLNSLELLVDLLAQRVGSPVSVNSLAGDLSVSDKTVSRWLGLLEDLYVIFRLTPYSRNVARGLKKISKFYFFDLGRVEGDESAKLENLAALAIRKQLDYLEDTKGVRTRFHFLRTKDQNEIDFFVQVDNQTPWLIEVKLSDAQVSPNFALFGKWFPSAKKIQWVRHLEKPYTSRDGVRVEPALEQLAVIHFKLQK